MMSIKVAIVQFPGSTCEREAMSAIQRSGMEPVSFLWNNDIGLLDACDAYVIVGGFSYNDRSRAGVIASIDPVMQEIARQSALGKLVLGIGNGAQILVESGLVPGTEERSTCIALTSNKRVYFDKVLGTGFYNAWTSIKMHEKAAPNAFTIGLLPEDILNIPLAHAEGRFQIPEDLLEKMTEAGTVVFQYCSQEGKLDPQFPVNPNGSVCNIAAVSNYAGNVLAIMPHPERTENGDAIFNSMRDFIEEKETLRAGKFDYQLQPVEMMGFKSSKKQLLVDQVFVDNEAVSIQLALKQLGIQAQVKRYVHWELGVTEEVLEKVLASKALFNPKKEFMVERPVVSDSQKSDALVLLVRAHEDFVGQQKFQLLANHFEIDGIKCLTKGVVWQITSTNMTQQKHAILASGLLFNPVAQHVYDLSDAFDFQCLPGKKATKNMQVEK